MTYDGFSNFTMRIVGRDDEAAIKARALIASSFRRRLGAYPDANHDWYLVIEAQIANGRKVVACSSITFANEQSLFSENYFSGSVEKQIADHFDVDSPRSSICEIGSLATDPVLVPSVKRVVAYFPWFAYQLGFEYALVTVTSYMREALAEAGATFRAFCSADPQKLSPEERLRWGKYYDFAPQAGVIDLKMLDFLNKAATEGNYPNEVIIQPGLFRRVDACS